MKYCPNCGKKVDPKAVVCPNCGVVLDQNFAKQNAAMKEQEAEKQVHWGWKLLSLVIPIVGWILYFYYNHSDHPKARACALWAWIGFAANLIIAVIES
ncbi:hypothetical protein FC35_GL001017 [Limosilactobacillus coleohominis DSM 14060]|nr:hypothetical protein FC35_GL001017 [Limosilactobacillus coleohominis DSM 14060]